MALFNDTVAHKKKFLSSVIKSPFEQLAASCGPLWNSAHELTQSLQRDFRRLPHCQLLYAIDTAGRQVSASVARNQVDTTWQGQDLSARPYLQGNLPYRGMTLSAAYLSQRSMQPCITALQAVRFEKILIGFVAADFHLKELPEFSAPALRRLLRQTPINSHGKATRISSSADDNIDYLSYILITLLQEHGVYQFMLHFNSDRCALWSIADPMNYQLHRTEDLFKPGFFAQYPKQPYCTQACIDLDKVPLILAQFKALRETNETNLLRSASFNLVNGMVSLCFNSDGTHYVSAEDFLNRELQYWLDTPSVTPPHLAVETEN
ncbi:MAG: hypothetical protein HY080_04410 [Gammaproteobacteria bacterium]|nr:hypothetical protein [Gammaproteobacteria bacterium]